jgi:hypothetical protein
MAENEHNAAAAPAAPMPPQQPVQPFLPKLHQPGRDFVNPLPPSAPKKKRIRTKKPNYIRSNNFANTSASRSELLFSTPPSLRNRTRVGLTVDSTVAPFQS